MDILNEFETSSYRVGMDFLPVQARMYETETRVDKGADGDGANEEDLGENIKVLMMVEE